MVSMLDLGLSGPGLSTGSGVNALNSQARHFTLTIPLFAQEYLWALKNLVVG